QLSVFYKHGEESRVKLVLEKLVERELKDKDKPVTKMTENEQQQSGLMLIKEKLFVPKTDKMETVESNNYVQEEIRQLIEKQKEDKPYEVIDSNGKIEMTLVIDRNGVFERLEKDQL